MSGERFSRTYMRERWFGILEKALADEPRGIQGVADRLGHGCGRSALSLILSGAYPAQPVTVSRRVLEVYDCYRCPYLGHDVRADFCAEIQRGPVPTWDPAALDLRRACQRCEQRPKHQEMKS
ncbi:MAG: LacI family transcriptional regulator [Candidatus Accumulibacter cognatus]|uniref:LacI family transcriptional regulator n=1 Tax=Candidatus Accumulibacter cognatus TaxID=2954383 RepID=A0A7D5SEH9_9PROT|nr:MAG: LacI family transcriptional regulator [Candidatus Accumulibacter cognatus]